MMLCFWFDVTGIVGAPRGPYWFCLSRRNFLMLLNVEREVSGLTE